jgi:ABC-type transporter Mla maintaining outer membrane lipid asymmetry permease subunit MlaE
VISYFQSVGFFAPALEVPRLGARTISDLILNWIFDCSALKAGNWAAQWISSIHSGGYTNNSEPAMPSI